MRTKRLHLAIASVVAAVVALGAAASTTSAGTSAAYSRGTSAPNGAQLIGTASVSLKINKFVRRGSRLVALGTAITRFTPVAGNPAGIAPASTTQPFVATASTLRNFDSAQRICPVLSLTIQKLDLSLLGLLVHLDRVHLTITA